MMPKPDYTPVLKRALTEIRLDNKRLLLIIPDHTRTAPVGTLVKIIYSFLKGRVKKLDILVALGTHPKMSREAILKHLSLTAEEYQNHYAGISFFNHEWDNSTTLQRIGVLEKSFIKDASRGCLNEDVVLFLNKRIFDYDHLLVLSPVFPHEIAGFSGGSKYFFPGISGSEIIDISHWLGALIGNRNIIGRIDTPVRTILDKAAECIPKPVTCIAFVVHEGKLPGLFVGPLKESWRKAALLAQEIHIVRKPKPYRKVLACAPAMYDDLWTGGKCMYKCESVVQDGGELVIYAPHITSLSYTHSCWLEKIGYHISEYFSSNMELYKDIPRSVMSVSAYIKGSGTYTSGVEKPRIQVTIASHIPKALCTRLGLGYMNPGSIDISKWKNREDEGILYVENAGETLFLLNEGTSVGL